eukprot:1186835-Prorocentrum_minimum.AAC.8
MNALWMRPGSAVIEVIEHGLYYKKRAVLERERSKRNPFARLFGSHEDDALCATPRAGYWFDKLRMHEALGLQWLLANARPDNRYPNGTKMKDDNGVDMEDRLSNLEACIPCVLRALKAVSRTMAQRGCAPFYTAS